MRVKHLFNLLAFLDLPISSSTISSTMHPIGMFFRPTFDGTFGKLFILQIILTVEIVLSADVTHADALSGERSAAERLAQKAIMHHSILVDVRIDMLAKKELIVSFLIVMLVIRAYLRTHHEGINFVGQTSIHLISKAPHSAQHYRSMMWMIYSNLKCLNCLIK